MKANTSLITFFLIVFLFAASILAHQAKATKQFNDEDVCECIDLDHDGSVTASDALRVLRISVGLDCPC